MMRGKTSEHAEQAAVITWWRYVCYGYKLPEFALFAIPNAAKRSYALAAWSKAEGLRAGIPDLMLAAGSPRDASARGLFIEMKSERGRLSPSQVEVLHYLSHCGYHCSIAHGSEEAIRAITNYLAAAGSLPPSTVRQR